MPQDALQASPLTWPLGQDLGVGVIDWEGGIATWPVHAFDFHVLYHSKIFPLNCFLALFISCHWQGFLPSPGSLPAQHCVSPQTLPLSPQIVKGAGDTNILSQIIQRRHNIADKN